MLQLHKVTSVGLPPLRCRELSASPGKTYLRALMGQFALLGLKTAPQTDSVQWNLKPDRLKPASLPMQTAPEEHSQLPASQLAPVEPTPLRVVRPWLKLMSYNAEQFYKTGKGKLTKPQAAVESLAEAIRAEDPEVIALQEVGDRKLLEEFNRQHLHNRYPNIVTGHISTESPMQVALMSKENIKVVSSQSHWKEIGKSAKYGGKRDFLEATFQTDSGYRFTVYNAHCKSMNGGEAHTAPVRLQEATNMAEILRKHLRREPDAHIFLTGDMNTLYDSTYGKPVINKLTRITDEAEPDLAEVMLKDGKAEPTHSGHDQYPDSKLDYTFASRPLAKQVVKAYVAGDFKQEPWSKASDHLPYVTVFEEAARSVQPQRSESGPSVAESTPRSLKRKLDRIA